MRSGYEVEQLFLRLRGGQFSVECVLVAPSGALKHDTVTFPTRSELEAVKRAARYLAGRGDVEGAEGVRLRVERRGELKDEKNLKRFFVQTFQDELEDALDGF